MENHYGALQGAWKQFVQYYRGAWVAECLDTYPQHKDRFNAWLTTNAQPVSNQAAAKLSEVCNSYTDNLIQENQSKIESYIARGATGEAVTWTRSFAGYLKRPIVAGCKDRAVKVKEITEEYIPGIRNKAKLAGMTTGFANRVFILDRTLRKTEEALASKGAHLLEAPGVLTSSQGKSDFARSLSTCVSQAKELRTLGADDSYTLVNRQAQKPSRLPPGATWKQPAGPASLTLLEAERLCSESAANVEELFARVATHNEKFAAQRNKAWEKKYLKGSGMRRVYNENKKRWPDVENLGSTVIWTYRSYTTGALANECKEYVFSKSGKLKKRSTRLCN